MSNSILEENYKEPDRPYSQNELFYNREKFFKKFRISILKANHSKCKHFYFVKENGRKEKEIQESKQNIDIGNCSICWKLSKTPRYLRERALDLIDSYLNTFYEEKKYLSYENLELEKMFYLWLYEDFN